MWIKNDENKSFGFVPPAGMAANQEVLFPCWEKQTPDASATLAVNIKQMVNTVEVGEMAANMTVNLTVAGQVTPGASLIMKLKSDGTGRDVTFGTGFLSPVLSGVADKTKYASFIYDGTQFVPTGTPVQVD